MAPMPVIVFISFCITLTRLPVFVASTADDSSSRRQSWMDTNEPCKEERPVLTDLPTLLTARRLTM